MLYLVSGTLDRREIMLAAHEEFVKLIKQTVIPSFTQLVQWRAEGKILAGGVPASAQGVVFILDLPTDQSHFAVRRLLFTLPIFNYFRWEVTPLETFEEWMSMFKG